MATFDDTLALEQGDVNNMSREDLKIHLQLAEVAHDGRTSTVRMKKLLLRFLLGEDDPVPAAASSNSPDWLQHFLDNQQRQMDQTMKALVDSLKPPPEDDDQAHVPHRRGAPSGRLSTKSPP